MKKNNKGFTLIELLAVIIILAIIALIAVPTIMGIIDDARQKSEINSAYGVVSAAETYYANQLLTNNNLTLPVEFNDTASGNVKAFSSLAIKGEKPVEGTVKICSGSEIGEDICANREKGEVVVDALKFSENGTAYSTETGKSTIKVKEVSS